MGTQRHTQAPDALKRQLQFLDDDDDDMSESGKSTDVDSVPEGNRKKKNQRKSRRKMHQVSYEEIDLEVESDGGSEKNLTRKSKKSISAKRSSSEEEKDWL